MHRRNPENPVLKATLLLTSTLVVMVTGVLVSALPAVQAHFAVVPNAAFWVSLVLTVPALFVALVAPMAGYLVDHIGRKKVLAISTLVYGLAGLAGYAMPTLTWLLISRAALGIAVGGLMTSLTTLIADYYAGEERGQFLGLQAAFMGFAGTAWLALGGVLVEVDWRVPFLAYALAFVLLPLVLVTLYEPLFVERCAENPPPLPDTGSCVAESLRATRSIPTEGAAVSAPLRFIAFAYLMVLGMQVILFLLPMQLPFYLSQVMEASASRSGLAIAAMSGAYALASTQYGRISSRLDHVEILATATGLIGAGYLAIWSAGGWPVMVSGLVVAGIGQGLLSPTMSMWLAEATPAASRGRVLGGLTTAMFLGIFVSPIVGQPMVDAMGFRSLCLSAAVLLLTMASLFWVTRGQLRSLTGGLPLELPTLEPGPCEAQSEVVPNSGTISTTKEGRPSSSNGLPRPQGCSSVLSAGH